MTDDKGLHELDIWVGYGLIVSITVLILTFIGFDDPLRALAIFGIVATIVALILSKWWRTRPEEKRGY